MASAKRRLHNFAVHDICVSDHRVILFDTELSLPALKLPVPTRVRILNSTAPSLFSCAYIADPIVPVIESPSTYLTTDAMLDLFHTSCLHILDSIAPLKAKARRKIAIPWLDESTRSIRRDCRKESVNGQKTDYMYRRKYIKNSCLHINPLPEMQKQNTSQISLSRAIITPESCLTP
ncbi:hypothetical protein N1851_023277 [Merluccius polli]|uniref:Uncharacterized protein n=1 Tax=Merluccius polli TaxID=89951 RepID=A0AA47NWF3_MERPO|nr:hypothetical protein N1851_023277 [Merluccius polli]